MPRSTKKALLSPSKITAWLDCEHYLTLKNNPERRRNRQQSRGTSDNAKTETTQEQEIGILEAPTDFADMLRKKAIYMKENVSKTIKKNSAVQFSKSLNKTEKKENHLKLG